MKKFCRTANICSKYNIYNTFINVVRILKLLLKAKKLQLNLRLHSRLDLSAYMLWSTYHTKTASYFIPRSSRNPSRCQKLSHTHWHTQTATHTLTHTHWHTHTLAHKRTSTVEVKDTHEMNYVLENGSVCAVTQTE